MLEGFDEKNHIIGTYEINKTSLSCFDQISILNNGYYGLALDYSWKDYLWVNYKKTVILITL